LVLDGLQNGTNSINIKGLMAGNPGMMPLLLLLYPLDPLDADASVAGTNNDWYYNEDEWAFITFMYSHGLIPQTAYSNAVAACGWDHFLVDVCTKSFNNPTPDCRKATARAITYLPRNIDVCSTRWHCASQPYTRVLTFLPCVADVRRVCAGLPLAPWQQLAKLGRVH